MKCGEFYRAFQHRVYKLRAIIRHGKQRGGLMSISPVSGSPLQYQIPQTPQAKADDERAESTNTKIQEAQIRKDLPVQVRTKIVAINIKVLAAAHFGAAQGLPAPSDFNSARRRPQCRRVFFPRKGIRAPMQNSAPVSRRAVRKRNRNDPIYRLDIKRWDCLNDVRPVSIAQFSTIC